MTLPLNQIICCDVREGLASLPDESVDVIFTSPPYWTKRDYGVLNQIGREPTHLEFVNTLADIFDDARRVLKPRGTAVAVIDDTYAKGGRRGRAGLKPGELCLIPQRLSIALQERGWWVINYCIWYAPNKLPHPTSRRLVNKYETVFLLAKHYRPDFELGEIREPHSEVSLRRNERRWAGNHYHRTDPHKPKELGSPGRMCHPDGKNPGDVIVLPTNPTGGEHTAIFPEALVWKFLPALAGPGKVVLDPFCGSGTVFPVAAALGADWIGFDINPDYVKLAYQKAQVGLFRGTP
uniref:site-specific DNA-methyltransferase (cytosine-N(4)-specific) n=1 Tax=viral metagenome TaxID=1070528 RepID=A0A6M3IY44_9ZZZZ